MADWSKLPKDLLQLISQKLDSEFYQLRFRSVCTSWRSSSIPKIHHLNLPSKFSFPSESNNNNNNASTFPLTKRTILLITPPPPSPNHRQTLNHPWLIKIGPDSHGNTRLWNPLSRDYQFPLSLPQLFDFNQLSVSVLGHEFVIGNFPSTYIIPNAVHMRKVVVCDTLLYNDNNRCSVLLTIHMSGKLAIFRSGDDWWTIMPETPPTPYTDVCVFNGRLIAVDRTGKTVAVGPDLSLDLVAEAVFGGDHKLLVVSDGELLLVDKYMKFEGERMYDINGKGTPVKFVVFRLNEKEKKWIELKNLGDKVLFLGEDCAFSSSASDLCMGNANCVISRDDICHWVHSDGLGIDVFCSDNQQIFHLPDLPCCSDLIWPPPQWSGLQVEGWV